MTNRNDYRRRPERRKRQARRRNSRENIHDTRKSNGNDVNNRGIFISFIRGIFFICLFSIFIIFLASFYIRDEVKQVLSKKITQSTSVVFSKPFPITMDISIKDHKIENRLNRLQYRRVDKIPTNTGEYSILENYLYIFTRESWINPNTFQKEDLYEIKFNNLGIVQSISNYNLKSSVRTIWLESEILSVLGNTSQRIVTSRTFDEFSPYLKNALIAIEDEHFYSHFGIDPFSIIRALYVNLKSGRVVQGGSTITQQLAKNMFFSSERKLIRKIKEAFASIMIETSYTKEQIFEMYLNEIFLGQEGRFAIHGFGEASLTFFGKEVSDLTLGESALLAGLVKAPTSYSPRRNLKKSLNRQEIVLNRMESIGMISEDEKNKAINEKIKIFPPVRNRRIAPYFVDYIQREITSLIEDKSIKGGSLNIITSLDTEYQSCAEIAVNEGLNDLKKNYPWLKDSGTDLQASLVSLIPSSGEIRAWVGGKDFGKSQFDRISQSRRQPGSTFKPFVYLTALDGNLNQYRTAKATSILMDQKIQIKVPGGVWEPKNYSKEYKGEVRLREALAKSLNIPTVQLAQKVGINNIARTAAFFGFGENLPKVPSLALGAGEISPLELTQAYAIIANSGIKRTINPIHYAIDSQSSEEIYQFPIIERRVLDEAPIFILTDILRSAIEQGTGQVVRRLGVKGPIAGKTGTTNDSRDSWFVGFSPRILTTVWVGNDSNKTIKLTGAQAAAPIWAKYMKCIEKFEPELDFFPPENIIFQNLDRHSGLLMTPYCPEENSITEIFVKGTEPVTPCPLHSEEGEKYIKSFINNNQ